MTALGGVTSGLGAFALVLAGLLICSFYTSISGLFKAELFPAHVRALGVGLSYGIGNALFGGTAENVAFAFKKAGPEPRLLNISVLSALDRAGSDKLVHELARAGFADLQRLPDLLERRADA